MVYIKARPNGGFLITVSCGRDAQDHKISKSVTMFTGCRRGELIALRWSDIDFESSSVKVSKSTCRTNGKMITKTTKTGATREIAVPELICKMARQWQIEQLRQQLMIGSKWEGEDFVFTQWNGRQMGLETPYHAFQRIIKNYNENRKEGEPELPVIPLHGLRHPYVKPTTKKFITFFEVFRAAS